MGEVEEVKEKNNAKNNAKKALSYDELKNIASQLQQQNAFLIEQLKKTNDESFYKRIDFLFKVIEFNKLFPEEFVQKCVTGLIETITIVDDSEQLEKVESK